MNFPKVAALALVGVALCAPARANDVHRLAYSKKMGVEILAKKTEGAWCRTDVDLRVVAENNGFFASDKFKTLMTRLGMVIGRECPAAKKANIEGVDKATGAVSYSGVADAGSKWLPKQTAAEAIGSSIVAESKQHEDIWSKAEDFNYGVLLAYYVRQHPDFLEDDRYLQSLASYYELNEYRGVLNNEFKFQPYLKSFKSRVTKLPNQASDFVKVTRVLELETYEFDQKGFPIKTGTKLLAQGKFHYSIKKHSLSEKFPQNFYIEDYPSVLFLAMEQSKAEQLFSKGRNGFKDREITAEFLFRVRGAGSDLKKLARGYAAVFKASKVDSELIGVRFFYDKAKKKPIGQIGQEEIRLAAVKAKRIQEERLAKEQQDALVGQYQKDKASLGKLGFRGRLAYVLGTGARLSSFSTSVAQSLIAKSPVAANVLVRISAVNSKDAAIDWPSKASLLLPSEPKELTKGAWAILSGNLVARQKGREAPEVEISVDKIVECKQLRCEDVKDDNFLLQKRYPEIAMNNKVDFLRPLETTEL